MAGLFEINQTAKREDLLDLLTRVDEKATPFLSTVRRGATPSNTYMQWVVDKYDDVALGGIVDGTDVSSYGNHAEDRALLSSYLQTFRKTSKVSRLAQEVSDVAGVTDEIADAIAKRGVEILRNMEATCLSDQEHQADDGVNPYLMRGLGVWILDTANIGTQTSHQVPAAYRPAAGQMVRTAVGSLTETNIQTLLQTIWNNTGMLGDYKLIAGSGLRRAFTDFTRTISTAGYASRDFNFDGNSNRVANTTTIFEGDFGTVEILPSSFIGYSADGSTQDTNRGYLLDMDKLDIRFHKNPTVERFEDQGGGERFMIEARASLQCRNPLGLAQFNTALSA